MGSRLGENADGSVSEWLEENGEEWDLSKPKLACPEKQFKECLKEYK